ncbi:hypothetical protein PR202_gb15798 [Eleusine coracana subsp. coracana]|uniref:Uncharacterized protein n=1 Tax=Eleusine coracana subsp. coracana TaxID=191504 RepID=A0AAV5F033_ELECO|nr:hypothetical protein PR202_gb15798 [Eleusine coracana subsp. coracana]
MSGYACWTKHGEHKEVVDEDPMVEEGMCNNVSIEQDIDVGIDNDVDDLDEMLRNMDDDFNSEKFSMMMKDYETPLFSGCKKEHNKLHVVLILLQMKASNNWSDKSFTELLQFMKNLLLKENELPQNTYQAKKVVCPLGLEVEKIHACRNDCMLFRGGNAMLEECRICGSSRYKQNAVDMDENDTGEVKK